MKNKVIVLILLFSFLTPAISVQAQEVDYVANAIEALKTSSVYIAPGTPGTDYNTPAELSAFLSPELSVVLIMLPSEALNGTDILTIAQKISIGLNNEKTIGLAVGNKVIGYSVRIPEDVASELMVRADSVSNNTTTALVAFSRNVQLWLVRNPQPIPTSTPKPTPTPRPTMQPIELPEINDVPFPLRVLTLVIFLIVVLLLANPLVKTAKRSKRKNYLYSIRPTIKDIQVTVTKIEELKVRKDLDGACKAAFGLLNSFLQSNEPVGDPEKYFPMLLTFMDMQICALIDHETQLRPLDEEQLSQLKYLLLNYDSLFIRLQKNDPEAIRLMTSMVKANKIMAESLGYQTN